MRTSLFILLNFIDSGSNIKIAEIGTLHGDNAVDISINCPNSKIITIDNYSDGNEGMMVAMKEKIKPYNIEFIHKSSVEAAKDYPDGYFDYVYIDGEHSKENVTKDILAWYPKVKKGGMLAGHDFWFDGVRKGVIPLALNNNLNLFFVGGFRDHVPTDLAKFYDWWIWK